MVQHTLRIQTYIKYILYFIAQKVILCFLYGGVIRHHSYWDESVV